MNWVRRKTVRSGMAKSASGSSVAFRQPVGLIVLWPGRYSGSGTLERKGAPTAEKCGFRPLPLAGAVRSRVDRFRQGTRNCMEPIFNGSSCLLASRNCTSMSVLNRIKENA